MYSTLSNSEQQVNNNIAKSIITTDRVKSLHIVHNTTTTKCLKIYTRMCIYCYSNMFKNEHNNLEINDHLGGGGWSLKELSFLDNMNK